MVLSLPGASTPTELGGSPAQAVSFSCLTLVSPSGKSWGKPCGLETISQADTFLQPTARLFEPQLWALFHSSFQGSNMESSNRISFPKPSRFHLLPRCPAVTGGNHGPVVRCFPTPWEETLLTAKSNLPMKPLVTKPSSEQDAGGEF